MNATECKRTGTAYIELLLDLDVLVGTDTAFLLGSWTKMARALAAPGDDDCTPSTVPQNVKSCGDFYVYNAKLQLTSWAGGYAGKHWNGLIKDYFAERVSRVMAAALAAAAAGKPFAASDIGAVKSKLDADFVSNFTVGHPEVPVGDPVAIGQAMYEKYKGRFSSCAAPDGAER